MSTEVPRELSPAACFELVAFEPAHRTGLCALIRRLEAWFEDHVWESIEAELAEDTTLVAVDGSGDPVGFIVVRFECGESGRITWMGVDPGHQRLGVGRSLVGRVLEEAEAAGLSRVYVETMSDQVTYEPFVRTRAFYRGVGFEPCRELGDMAGNGLLTTDWVYELAAVGA